MLTESRLSAQVFTLPIDKMNGPYLNTGVYLKGTALRDPFDEKWVVTGPNGGFTIYPDQKEYFLAAICPVGFVIKRMPVDENKSRPIDLQLEHWATVIFSSTGETQGQRPI